MNKSKFIVNQRPVPHSPYYQQCSEAQATPICRN